MAIRTYTQKNGSVWEWEETEELLKYIDQMHQKNARNPEGRGQNSFEKSKKS
jgi:hypothetical protein